MYISRVRAIRSEQTYNNKGESQDFKGREELLYKIYSR